MYRRDFQGNAPVGRDRFVEVVDRYGLKVRQFVVSPLVILLITENFMMDNRNDVEYLLSAEGREAIINSHIQGIVAYSTSPIISFTKTPVPMNFSP
jgi:hypothetical protein